MVNKIFFIRLISTLLMIVSFFMASWYLYTRYEQLNTVGTVIKEEDLNNPRLNQMIIDEIITDIDSRNLYTNDEAVDVVVSEDDPFYQ